MQTRYRVYTQLLYVCGRHEGNPRRCHRDGDDVQGEFLCNTDYAHLESIVGSHFLTVKRADTYYRLIPVFEKKLKHEGVHGLVESLNIVDGSSKRKSIVYLDSIGLYAASTKKLPFLISLARNFAKTIKLASAFHASTFNTSAEKILAELKAVLVDHCPDCISDFAQFLNTPMSHTHTMSMANFQIFFSCMFLYNQGQKDRHRARWDRCEGSQPQIIPNPQNIFLGLVLPQSETLVIGKGHEWILSTAQKLT